MIIWLTGQPCSGKSVLGNKLKEYLDTTYSLNCKRIDGDDLRDLIDNKDYSIKGRIYNVDIAQKLANYLHSNNETVIVSLVTPYLDQREEFKIKLGENIKEIYINTSEARERDHFKVLGYQKPRSNYLDIDTTEDTIQESLVKIINYIADEKQ